MVYAKRFERKYIIDFWTYEKIRKNIELYFDFDKHGKNGCYIVSSLYYDSPDFRFYKEKVNGEKIRSKLRLRTYKSLSGEDLVSGGKVFVEIKKRNNLNVSKKKVLICEDEAKKFISNPVFNKSLTKLKESEKYALTETMYLKNLYDIRPAVIVGYIRQAFVNKFGPKVRITFDKCVKYRKNNLNLNDVYCKDYLLDPRLIVMEIKYNEILPVWISNLISKHNLLLRTFGKYCMSIDKLIEKRETLYNKTNIGI